MAKGRSFVIKAPRYRLGQGSYLSEPGRLNPPPEPPPKPWSKQRDGLGRRGQLYLPAKLAADRWAIGVQDLGHAAEYRTWGETKGDRAEDDAIDFCVRANGIPDFIGGHDDKQFNAYLDRHRPSWNTPGAMRLRPNPRFLGLGWVVRLAGWVRPYVILLPRHADRPDWGEQSRELTRIGAAFLKDERP